jgi:hypothetical protein
MAKRGISLRSTKLPRIEEPWLIQRGRLGLGQPVGMTAAFVDRGGASAMCRCRFSLGASSLPSLCL